MEPEKIKIQDGDKVFARGLVGPGFVAHDDLEQLVHGLGPLASGHEQAGFG